MQTGQEEMDQQIRAATKYRMEIIEAGDYLTTLQKSERLAAADVALRLLRFAGSCAPKP